MNSAPLMPSDFPLPLAAYSHAMTTRIGDATMLFIAGQLALDATGAVVSPAVEVQTEFIFKSLATILEAAAMTFADLVKVQIFLTDIADVPKVSPIRDRVLGKVRPASTLVEVSRLAREGCRIEIDAVGVRSHAAS
jgi:2-iminobutanoate/2-iminopropanoate deaminase